MTVHPRKLHPCGDLSAWASTNLNLRIRWEQDQGYLYPLSFYFERESLIKLPLGTCPESKRSDENMWEEMFSWLLISKVIITFFLSVNLCSLYFHLCDVFIWLRHRRNCSSPLERERASSQRNIRSWLHKVFWKSCTKEAFWSCSLPQNNFEASRHSIKLGPQPLITLKIFINSLYLNLFFNQLKKKQQTHSY